MIVNGFAKGAENDPLFGQLATISRRDRNGVKNGVHSHFTPFSHRHAELLKGLFDLFAQEGVSPSLLHRARLGGASIVTAAAGWRGVVAVILIVKLIVMGFQPVRFFHLQPRAKRAQAELEHPLRLVTFGRNCAHHLFVDALRQFVRLQLGEEALFIVEVPATPGIHIVSCFSITRHSTAYTPKLSPQPHSFCAFGLLNLNNWFKPSRT
ncbi:hypothetical protein D3C85_1205300 [compost metagenome]